MEKQTIDITFYDVEMTVEGYYIKGVMGDYETPPEPRDFEVLSVHIGEADVTDLLADSYNYVKPNYKNWELETKIGEIETLILNEYL